MEKKKLYYYISGSLKENEQELAENAFAKLGVVHPKWYNYSKETCMFMFAEGDTDLYIVTSDNFKECIQQVGTNIVDLLEKDEPTFKPFDKVLVRDYDNDIWKATFFSHYLQSTKKGERAAYPYITIGSSSAQCIPYEGNERLVGTSDKPEL